MMQTALCRYADWEAGYFASSARSCCPGCRSSQSARSNHLHVKLQGVLCPQRPFAAYSITRTTPFRSLSSAWRCKSKRCISLTHLRFRIAVGEQSAGCPGSRGILSSQSSCFDISEHALAAQAAQFKVPRGAAVAGGCGMCTSSARHKIL